MHTRLGPLCWAVSGKGLPLTGCAAAPGMDLAVPGKPRAICSLLPALLDGLSAHMRRTPPGFRWEGATGAAAGGGAPPGHSCCPAFSHPSFSRPWLSSTSRAPRAASRASPVPTPRRMCSACAAASRSRTPWRSAAPTSCGSCSKASPTCTRWAPSPATRWARKQGNVGSGLGAKTSPLAARHPAAPLGPHHPTTPPHHPPVAILPLLICPSPTPCFPPLCRRSRWPRPA